MTNYQSLMDILSAKIVESLVASSYLIDYMRLIIIEISTTIYLAQIIILWQLY